MFQECSDLISLDLSSFDTSGVTNMSFMFDRCYNLTSLDLSNFYIYDSSFTSYMFDDRTSLHTLRLDNCNNGTIYKIITSSNFPTNKIDGKIRTIYCKRENAEGLTPPENWVFNFIDDITYSYDEETETITTLAGSYTYDPDSEQLTYTPGTNNSINYDSDDESLTF